VKKDYVEELGDSLDLVPIGAWWGNGRYVVSATMVGRHAFVVFQEGRRAS
jgi:hypothetical protein